MATMIAVGCASRGLSGGYRVRSTCLQRVVPSEAMALPVSGRTGRETWHARRGLRPSFAGQGLPGGAWPQPPTIAPDLHKIRRRLGVASISPLPVCHRERRACVPSFVGREVRREVRRARPTAPHRPCRLAVGDVVSREPDRVTVNASSSVSVTWLAPLVGLNDRLFRLPNANALF